MMSNGNNNRLENIEIRKLTADDAEKLIDIDRSEYIKTGYVIRKGNLEVDPVNCNVPRWSTAGKGDFNILNRIVSLRNKLQNGDLGLGAFACNGLMVGYVILQYNLTDTMAQLSELYVSRQYRRCGLATKLVDMIIEDARKGTENSRGGVSEMYVSSVPSESAVGFYKSKGFELAANDKLHPLLYAQEPDDIHMILKL